MKDPYLKLARLVSLKRRKTEQNFRVAQLELSQSEAEAEQLESELKTVDQQPHGFGATRLAYQHGYVQNLIRQLRANGEEMSRQGRELEYRRDALKRALDSDDRIKREELKRR